MFVTVPQDAFLLDVVKTLLVKIKEAVPTANVLPKHPDINEQLKLPVVVLTRVSEETMVLARNSGFYGEQAVSWDTTKLERLEGYRYASTYQLDIISRSNSEMLTLVWQLQSKLLEPEGETFFAEWYPMQWQEIPVKHFASATSTWTATDLRIRYKYKDISWTQVDGFDDEILQYSMTIPVWCDYMKWRNVDKIITVWHVADL